jgi:hypothetical protein
MNVFSISRFERNLSRVNAFSDFEGPLSWLSSNVVCEGDGFLNILHTGGAL